MRLHNPWIIYFTQLALHKVFVAPATATVSHTSSSAHPPNILPTYT